MTIRASNLATYSLCTVNGVLQMHLSLGCWWLFAIAAMLFGAAVTGLVLTWRTR